MSRAFPLFRISDLPQPSLSSPLPSISSLPLAIGSVFAIASHMPARYRSIEPRLRESPTQSTPHLMIDGTSIPPFDEGRKNSSWGFLELQSTQLTVYRYSRTNLLRLGLATALPLSPTHQTISPPGHHLHQCGELNSALQSPCDRYTRSTVHTHSPTPTYPTNDPPTNVSHHMHSLYSLTANCGVIAKRVVMFLLRNEHPPSNLF